MSREIVDDPWILNRSLKLVLPCLEDQEGSLAYVKVDVVIILMSDAGTKFSSDKAVPNTTIFFSAILVEHNRYCFFSVVAI